MTYDVEFLCRRTADVDDNHLEAIEHCGHASVDEALGWLTSQGFAAAYNVNVSHVKGGRRVTDKLAGDYIDGKPVPHEIPPPESKAPAVELPASSAAMPSAPAQKPPPLPPDTQVKIDFLKEHDIHPKVYRDHAPLIEDAWLFGDCKFSFILVVGPGGTGKTNIFRCTPGVNYNEYSATAEGAYGYGHDHVNEPICLSDVREDDLRALVEFLKGFTNTPKPVTVSMLKSPAYLKGRELPERYETSSPVALLLNKLPTKIDENVLALLTRAKVVFFHPTSESCHEYVKTFWKPEHKDIYDAVGEKLRLFPSVGIRKYENLRQTKEAGQDWRAELEEMVSGRIDPDAAEYRVSFSTTDPALPSEPPDIEPTELAEIAGRFNAHDAKAREYERKKCEAQYAKGKELCLVKARKGNRWIRWTETEEASRMFDGYRGSTLREFQTFAQRTDDSGENQKILGMGYLQARIYLRMRKPPAVGPTHPDCPPAEPKAPNAVPIPILPAAPVPVPAPVATIVATRPPAPAAPEPISPECFQIASEPGSIEILMVAEPSVESICAVLRQGAVSAAFQPGRPVNIRVVPVGRLEPQDLEAQSAEVEKPQKRKRDPELPPPLFPPESKK